MTLSDLTKYAEQYFGIKERHKQTGLPEVSELCHITTGGRIALLMRQWDRESGEIIEVCDLKCGKINRLQDEYRFLYKPFRMKGEDWIGIKFDRHTPKDTVFKLLNRAFEKENQAGSYTFTLDVPHSEASGYKDTPLFTADNIPDNSIPEKIRKMQQLYSYGAATPEKRAENFFCQGKFMEDYEDDFSWSGEVSKQYFTTYHDLNVKQLRGYFSWRTKIRKGVFERTADSFIYIYIYELLNGIGTKSAEEGLKKLQEIYNEVVNISYNSLHIQRNIRRWLPDFIIINNLPVKELTKYYQDFLLIDRTLLILAHPEKHPDSLILDMLYAVADKKTAFKLPDEGLHLAAEIWRYAVKNFSEVGGIMKKCFGGMDTYIWQPLSNAVYCPKNQQETIYEVNEIRKFLYHNGLWHLQCYTYNRFDTKLLSGILRLTEARLRRYFKTGRYLKENLADAWFLPYINAVLEDDKRQKDEALRPKISINLDSLENIRQNAAQTRDSLLTEDELFEVPEIKTVTEEKPPQEEVSDIETKILVMLLKGENPDGLIKAHRLMPTIIADSLNERFFDEIGDNIIECEGNTLKIVEDYKEDLKNLEALNFAL